MNRVIPFSALFLQYGEGYKVHDWVKNSVTQSNESGGINLYCGSFVTTFS